jgi:Tfp pilus assembly ATPase PilU
MNQSLFRLYYNREITKASALEQSVNPIELEQMMLTGRDIL